MSYDLTLFPVAKGEDVADVFFRRAKAADADDPNPGPGGDERQVEKREWMRELQACVPGLEPFAFDYAAIAESGGISETEARRRWRHIELNDDYCDALPDLAKPDDDDGDTQREERAA
jgi:hypothetical protein